MICLEYSVKCPLTVKTRFSADIKDSLVSVTQKTTGIFQTCFIEIMVKVHMEST